MKKTSVRRSSGARRRDIRWKVEIPGRGSASPVLWGDRVFVLTAVPVGVNGAAAHAPRGGVQPRDVHRLTVLAIDRRTGKTVWERVAREERPHEASHHPIPSPVAADGMVFVASGFRGSNLKAIRLAEARGERRRSCTTASSTSSKATPASSRPSTPGRANRTTSSSG